LTNCTSDDKMPPVSLCQLFDEIRYEKTIAETFDRQAYDQNANEKTIWRNYKHIV